MRRSRAGAATSAGLLVPAPWARDAAARAAGRDVGVHLTLTAELPRYRWGPVTIAPSLLGGDGGFPATVADLHDHADPDEVRRECRAQLERAVLFGVDPTHLSVHDDALFSAAALFDVARRARRASSGCRCGSPTAAAPAVRLPPARPRHRSAASSAPTPCGPRRRAPARDPASSVASLPEGVTELVVRPALDTDELRALAPDADERVADLDGLLSLRTAWPARSTPPTSYVLGVVRAPRRRQGPGPVARA